MSNIRCCATCIWWNKQGSPVATSIDIEGPSEVGTCQISPPEISGYDSRWPRTHAGRVCGGWEDTLDDEGGDDGGGERAGTVVPFFDLRSAA